MPNLNLSSFRVEVRLGVRYAEGITGITCSIYGYVFDAVIVTMENSILRGSSASRESGVIEVSFRCWWIAGTVMGCLCHDLIEHASGESRVAELSVYVDDIIFGSTNKELCTAFEKLMRISGFKALALKNDGGYTVFFRINLALVDDCVKDWHGSRSLSRERMSADSMRLMVIEQYTARSGMDSKMAKTCYHSHFAYTDSDCTGATQDRKSTTGSCQFLGNRLISWQCKKQTVVATSITKAEYVAAAKQFWQTAALSTIEDGVMKITATIDGRVRTITEASIRRHLKLEDSNGISTLPTAEIFKQLALMGYVTTYDSLTFQKGHFFPQWKFLIHTILHCLSPKKTAWEQFSSNIATVIICLATNKTFNFSNLIFEAMVKNLDNKSKFLMYPRFIQIFLNKHQILLLPHKRTYPTPTLTQKLFSNMKRASKGYSRVNTPLFQTMLVQDQALHEEAALMPHESPLPRVYSLGSDEGSLSLNELTVLCTSLSKKVESLKVKTLEQTIKTSQSKRRAKVMISDVEEDEEDSSKQGMSLIEELDMDARISLVPPHVADQGSAAKVLADAAEQRKDVENVQTYTRRRRTVSTGSGGVSTANELVSTAGVKAKDKGKAVMQESEPPKKIKKRVQVQMSIDEELAQKVHEEEQARFNAEQEAKFKAEQEQERLDHETEDILARVAADKDFVQQLQAGEKVSDEDLPRKLVELVNQRKKFFAQQRAKAKRNKPMTPAQQKEKVQYFMPTDYELEVQRLKRTGQDVVEEPDKRQRTREASGSVQEQTGEEPKAEELSQEQLHQIMMVIPVEEVYVEALQVKYPIIDWEIYSEDSRKYWKIIRVEGHTKAYQTFDDMLKKFDRDDMDKL
ncbi:hypothetical protein Tco_1134527 [Tanacetum coccineum]